MGSRHLSREAAIKALYQADILGESGPEELTDDDLFADDSLDDNGKAFANLLIAGVKRHMSAIDDVLTKTLTDWAPERLGFMERAIMRLALFEMLFAPATPDKVAITEAIELAKKYCDVGSEKLINGALDNALKRKDA